MFLTKLIIVVVRIHLIAAGVLFITGQAVAVETTSRGTTENAAVRDVDSVKMNSSSNLHDHSKESATPSHSAEVRLRLGERMYREGILPSGESMKASVKGDVRVESTTFSCVSCHMRGGLGSIEGGVTTPPATGTKLFQPYYSGTILSSTSTTARNRYVINPARRPSYTQETLAVALRSGINPTGHKLDDVMPRYQLRDEDMAILIDYLKSLSATASPGVDNTTLRIGTIITEDVPLEARKAMLEPLENFVAAKNSQAKVFATRTKYMRGGGFPEEVNLAYRTLSLARWELRGRPETWRNQLEELNRKEPVFAFVGGITTGEWKPFHDFCEDHKIPCLFPITDYPVISDTDWYTLYFSRGLYQEGEAAARFLEMSAKISPDSNIVQVVRNSSESRTLSAGFSAMWRELGNSPAETVTLSDSEPGSSDFLRQLIITRKPAAILLWTGPETISALKDISSDTPAPPYIFISTGYLKNDILSVPEKVRALTYITYPYRLPRDTKLNSDATATNLPDTVNLVKANRIATRAQAITEVLQFGLSMMNRNFYRDTFLDVISMMPDQTPGDYERLSFGPGQRYAAKGCYVVQLSEGTNPVLIKKSDWVIQ